jgi:4-amino-4-deoxy-L-arabinose transferase-like glycosyltransferase
MKKFLEKNYLGVIIAILSFMTIVSILNAQNDSLIYDEDAHIPAGYSYLTQHDMRLNPEHPPFLKDLAGFPLLFLDLKFDTTKDFWTKDNADNSQWNAGKEFLFQSGNNPDQIILWSRLPIILLSLILGLFIFKWASELAGTLAGLFALTLYAFDPNILGHNHFVTTDLGIAAFLTFSFYYFLRFIKKPTWKNVFLAGIFLGLVQLVKFSSVLAFPIFGMILLIYPLIKLHKNTSRAKEFGQYIWKGFVMFLVSIIIVYIAYWLNTYAMPQTKLPEIMSHYMHPDDSRPLTIYTRKAILAINNVPGLEPLADYVFGIARVFQRVGGGNVTYFLGEVSTQGFLAYFPIIFLIKEPLATLFLIFFALGIGIRKIIQASAQKESLGFVKKTLLGMRNYLRLRIVQFAMLSFILLYVFTSITGRLNIGFRHLFPILPFMYILVATTIFEYIRSKKDSHRKYFYHTLITIIATLLIAEAFFAYPYYTSYFNELVGGSKQGYQVATDSNADWGQDLKRLSIFLENHPEIEKVKLDYFGMTDLNYYLDGRYEKWWASKRPIETGWYAISTLFLQEGIYDQRKTDNESYRWLENKKPTYQVGTSILIYHILPEDL